MELDMYDVKIYLRKFDSDTPELVVDATVPEYILSTILDHYNGVNYLIKIFKIIMEDK